MTVSPIIADRATPALWRWAYGAWCADMAAAEIADKLGITTRQLYDHATRKHWPRRQAVDGRPYPTRWRCDCGALVVSSPICPRGHAASWKPMLDAGLLVPQPGATR